MTERVQALGLAILGVIALASLWAATSILGAEPSEGAVTAGMALITIATAVVTGIAGFMVGRQIAAPVAELVGTTAGAAPQEEA